jgi:hypothetical protein
MKRQAEYRCVNGHDRCAMMLPSPDCPHGEAPKRGRPVSTHCKRGHELAAHSLIAIDGRRRCLICRRISWRRNQRKFRASLAEPSRARQRDEGSFGYPTS